MVLLLTFVSVQSNAQTFLELNKQFLELFGAEKYSEAIVVGEKSVRQARIEFGTQHVNYAISLDNLATGYYRLGDLQKALVNYKFTITAYTSAGNPEYGSDLALTQNQVGNIYFGQGHYDSAVTYFKQSATYFNQHRDGNIENLLTVSKNIIDCYVELSDYDELFRSCDQLLPLIVEHKGKGDPLYYKVLFYKGMALFELGFAVEAEAVLHEALPLAEKHFTRNHLEYTEVLVMLFRAASGQQKNIEAERYILEAISIYESSLPSEKMSLALVYKGTGNFYSDRGDFSKAQEYFLKSLQLLGDLGLSADDLYHLTSQSLAYSYVQSGHLTEAKKMLDELTRIITASKGKESIEVAELLIVLGGVEVQLNQLSAAENHALEGIRIIKKITKGSHHLLAVAKEALGTVYNRLGNSQQSIATFKEALADETSSAGAETRQAASLYSNIGITYFEMGSYALAEEAYRKSLDIRKKLLGNQHPEYALSLINLGMVNVYQGRYIEADELLAAAAQIFISR
ncbi:MAG: peptidase-like, partial [Chitinophagaceae bacterium]|nr:peptidase-like [Chitinophagaceae bacterium]